MVIQIVRHQHVGNAQQKGDVGARLDGHPIGGEDAGVVQARIHDDHASALVGSPGQALHRRGADAVAVAATDEDHHLGVREIHGIVRCARGLLDAAFLRQVAGGGVGVHIGRAERIHEALAVVLARGTGILNDGQGLRSRLSQDLLHLGPDLGKGIVPADGGEAAVFGPLHGLGQATIGIGPLGRTVAATAQRSLGIGMLFHALHGPQAPIEGSGDQTALA